MCLRQGLPLCVFAAALACAHGARGEEKAHADANGDPLPERAVVRIGTLRFRHGTWITAVTHSPDGRTIAAGDEDGAVRLWDAKSGRELWSDLGYRGDRAYSPVMALAFAPDGKTLAAAVRSGASPLLVLLDTDTGKERRILLKPDAFIESVRFSPDGRVLAVAVPNAHAIQLLEADTGKELRRLSSFCSNPSSLAFSPDGRMVAGIYLESGVCLWECASGKEVHRLANSGNSGAALCFFPDGKRLAVAADEDVRIFDVLTGKEQGRVPVGRGGAEMLALTPDGKGLLAAGGYNVRLWDVRTGQPRRGSGLNREPVWEVIFSPDGQTVVGANRGKMRLYGVADGRLLSKWKAPHEWRESIQFAPDGHSLAWADITGVVSLLEPATGQVRLRITTPDDHHNKQPRWAPDGALLATAGMNGQVRLWDTTTGKLRRALPDPAGCALAFAFSPDGKALATVSRTGPVVVWEVATGRERMRLDQEAHWASGWGWGLAFLPGSRALTVGRPDGGICVHDLATGKQRYRLDGHRGAPTGLFFSPDGRHLLSAGNDLTALIWDLSGLSADPSDNDGRLTGRQMEGYWSDLAGDDAAAAYRAMVALRGAKDGVSFLKERLAVVSRSYPERAGRIARLMAALDSERFEGRETATRELKELRDDAEPQLRRAPAGKPSPEVRRRVEDVLQGMEEALPSREWLRLLRAVEVLEASAAPAAREALEALAGSSAEARLPLEAKASLRRLDRRLAAGKP